MALTSRRLAASLGGRPRLVLRALCSGASGNTTLSALIERLPIVTPEIGEEEAEQRGAAEAYQQSCSKVYPEEFTAAEEGPEQGPARYIVLVRHGQYVHDEERHLSELGRKQAEATGARLAARADLPISRIVYSDVTRAKETFEIIRKQLGPEIPVEESQLLREGAPIPPDPPHSTWLPSASQFFQEGARIEAGFRAFFHRSDPDDDKVEYELLVCHGNVIRYCVLRALQLPPEAWLRLSHANCGITIVRISGSGSVSLEAFGDVGHLPSDMITFN